MKPQWLLLVPILFLALVLPAAIHHWTSICSVSLTMRIAHMQPISLRYSVHASLCWTRPG